jgi:SPP1 family phage portal protein
MNLPDLTNLIDNGEIDKLKSIMEVSKYAYFLSDSFQYAIGTGLNVNKDTIHIRDFRQYNPKQHDVFDKTKRGDKEIKREEKGPNGEDTGRTVIDKLIPVARLGIPEQRKIVTLAAAFLGTPTLSCTPKAGIETDMFDVLTVLSDDNKLDYKFKNIAKKTMSERECAELWYTQDAEPEFWDGTAMTSEYKLRMRILSPSLGDTLYPVKDEFGDMIAFGRFYETVEQIENTLQQTQRVAHLDIYTADRFYFMTKDEKSASWAIGADPTALATGPDTAVVNGVPNPLGKIPVVYYAQPTTEWSDVQEMIARLETKVSNHADTNDYFDSPIVFLEGTVTGFADKGESGKLLQGTEGAKASYLTWDHAPESTKMEIENLLKFIHTYTHTPDISFESIKGLGTFSGIALKMFFMDAHLKASDKEEIFGEGIQRRINYLKASIIGLDPAFKAAARLVIKPVFEYFLPRNEAEEIDNINKAYTGGFLSLETAVRLNPLVEDAVSELAKIKAEKAQASADALKIAQQSKPVNGLPMNAN